MIRDDSLVKSVVPRSVAWLAGFSLLLAMAYVCWFTFRTGSFFMDDAYIGFRYLDNLLEGRGLTFNPPDRVEGVTNLGWLLFLLPFALFMPVTLAAKMAGLVLVGITLFLLVSLSLRTVRDIRDAMLFMPVPLLVAVQFDYLYFSLAGMETALLSVLLLGMAYLATLGASLWFTVALAAFSFLVRPEALLILPVAYLLGTRLPTGRRVLLLGVYCLVVLAVTLARVAYFGDPVPNTFMSKPSGVLVALAGGWDFVTGASVNVPFPFDGLFGPLFLAYGAAGLFRVSRSGFPFVVGPVLVGLAFAIYARPDWTGTARYFAPYLPLAMLLLWRGLVELHRDLLVPRMGERWVSRLIVCYFAVLLLLGGGAGVGRLTPAYTESYPGYVLAGTNLVEPALWIRDNLPPDAVIATRRIGAVSYYSGLEIFDYKFGLPDREVARLVAARGDVFDDPNAPELAGIWREANPGYFLEDRDVVERVAAAAGGSPADFTIQRDRFRVMRSFAIGQNVQWTLCEKLGPPVP